MPQCSDRPGIEYPVIRTVVFLMLSVLFLFLAVLQSAAEPAPDDAEALRSFLQSHYSITILMGDECSSLSLSESTVKIIPEGNSLFQSVYAGNSRFAGLLKLMDDVFSVYPPGFFSCFSTPDSPGLRFALADELSWKGIRTGGIQTMINGWFDIVLSLKDTESLEIHHELWHAMEQRILQEEPDAFSAWAELNPEGFAYSDDYSGMTAEEGYREPDDWFAREYSKVSEYEDRATVYGFIMTKDEAWWSTRPHLRSKAAFLLEKAEPVFGDLFAGE